MRVYGFRVHTLQPQFQRKKTYLKLDNVGEVAGVDDAFEALCTQLEGIKGKLQVGTPTFIQDELTEIERDERLEKSDDAPHFILNDVVIKGRRITCQVRTGRESDYEAVSARTGLQEPMDKKAAVRSFEIAFAFPSAGDYGFMVSEVIGGGYAGLLLMHWLTRTAQRSVSAFDEHGKRREDPWLNWHIVPRVDSSRIDNIMDGSSNHRVELTREGVKGDGTPHGEKITLTRWGFEHTPKEEIANAIRKLAARKNDGNRTSRKKHAADDLVQLVDSNLNAFGFNDGQFVFQENGKTQRIHSEVVEELYVYPNGAERESIADTLERIQPIIKNIADSIKQDTLDY